jgi:hypothetical protein
VEISNVGADTSMIKRDDAAWCSEAGVAGELSGSDAGSPAMAQLALTVLNNE